MMIGWRRFACAWGLATGVTGCLHVPDVPGYATVPFTLHLPSGERLTGSVTTRLLRREFYATDGRTTCSGLFHPSGAGLPASVGANCSNGQRGTGSADGTSSFAGSGTLRMDGGSATFRYGEAIQGG
ncbi:MULTISPECIES: hypothetical protein [Methylobacteriaceae]|nr:MULTISPECIES: hypothetical protein [Methylobacterium]MBY0144140.1 hypothetical protein [Methylorubrum populi]